MKPEFPSSSIINAATGSSAFLLLKCMLDTRSLRYNERRYPASYASGCNMNVHSLPLLQDSNDVEIVKSVNWRLLLQSLQHHLFPLFVRSREPTCANVSTSLVVFSQFLSSCDISSAIAAVHNNRITETVQNQRIM